ncbi:hypothetical protein CMV_012134 [Castanea mollissima]|uniref:Uncharacterized protein n=1 Tax=Castanea mollissima TaxID=60419 RepID=A0A8J4RA19_9ROSI|nr:hypothetical protein CMV_012134 [Castanea mollissima]
MLRRSTGFVLNRKPPFKREKGTAPFQSSRARRGGLELRVRACERERKTEVRKRHRDERRELAFCTALGFSQKSKG